MKLSDFLKQSVTLGNNPNSPMAKFSQATRFLQVYFQLPYHSKFGYETIFPLSSIGMVNSHRQPFSRGNFCCLCECSRVSYPAQFFERHPDCRYFSYSKISRWGDRSASTQR